MLKRINIMKINNEFAQNGYFSEYLPPSFSLSRNECIDKLFDGSITLSNKNDLAEPVCFSMSRFKTDGSRRVIYIPELCSYISAIRVMIDNQLIGDLINSLPSKVSFSPLLQP